MYGIGSMCPRVRLAAKEKASGALAVRESGITANETVIRLVW
jgi:hypothetical protein